MKDLFQNYEKIKGQIEKRLNEFKALPKDKFYDEMMFCLLTPQSNAQKCFEAVELLKKEKRKDFDNVSRILRGYTRFHNNKTRYILASNESWKVIRNELDNEDRISLRNYIANNVKGFGLKEASHFLRNIGKSDNKIAILDRHILRNLKNLNVIQNEMIKSENEYLNVEQKFLKFSDKIGIPIDHLDLLFWSKENGEIFK